MGNNVTSSRKIFVSLLISVFLFACFSILAFTELFSVIDVHFYEPSKISQVQKHLDIISENYSEYLELLENRFYKDENSILKNETIRLFVEENSKAEIIQERLKILKELIKQTPGFLGLRILDKDGTNIYFSTFDSDFVNQNSTNILYKNYADAITSLGNSEIPFSKISFFEPENSLAIENLRTAITFDGRDNRIIFSYPYYDSEQVLCRFFLFYVSANDFNRFLVSKKIITFNETGILVSGLNLDDEQKQNNYKSGFVFGIPNVENDILRKEIISHWEQGFIESEKIVYKISDEDSGEKSNAKIKNDYWILFSSTKSPFGFISGIYPEKNFLMPDSLKILLLTCVFVTLFLVVFMIVNLKHDDMFLIRERIRKLEWAIVDEHLKKKEEVDWKIISKKIAERRQDVTHEIIRSLGRKAKKHIPEVKELINRSWNEILSVMDISKDKNETTQDKNTIAHTEQLEELEELEELEPSFELEQVEKIDEPKNVSPISKLEKQKNIEQVEKIDDQKNVSPISKFEKQKVIEQIKKSKQVNFVDLITKPKAKPIECEAEELTNKELDMPFTFIRFGNVTSNSEELKPYTDVIQEKSGLYIINTDGLDEKPQDFDFKNLVDAVLKK